jgi:hypothetical protein
MRLLSLPTLVFLLILSGCSNDEQSGVAATSESATDTQTEAPADNDSGTAAASTDSASGEPDEPAFKSAGDIGMTLRWRVVGDEIEIEVSGPTTGWIAVGFKPSRAMKDANIFIGYVASGEAVMADQFGVSMTDHREDEQLGGSSHVRNVSGSESDGTTTIRFTVPLDSGDEYDQPLAPGETVTVILAYGPDDADDLRAYHENRAGIEITI